MIVLTQNIGMLNLSSPKKINALMYLQLEILIRVKKYLLIMESGIGF